MLYKSVSKSTNIYLLSFYFKKQVLIKYLKLIIIYYWQKTNSFNDIEYPPLKYIHYIH